MPQTTQWAWAIASHNNTSAADWWSLVAELHSLMIGLNKEGFQGYYTITGLALGPWSFGGYFLAYDKSNATIQATLAPFSVALNAAADLAALAMWNVTRYDTWIEAFNGLPKQVSDNSDGPGGSISVTRLLTREDLTKNVEAVASMFESIGPQTEESEVCFPGLLVLENGTQKLTKVAWRYEPCHRWQHDCKLKARRRRSESRLARRRCPYDRESRLDRESSGCQGTADPE
jgi:hypothetical protein